MVYRNVHSKISETVFDMWVDPVCIFFVHENTHIALTHVIVETSRTIHACILPDNIINSNLVCYFKYVFSLAHGIVIQSCNNSPRQTTCLPRQGMVKLYKRSIFVITEAHFAIQSQVM